MQLWTGEDSPLFYIVLNCVTVCLSLPFPYHNSSGESLKVCITPQHLKPSSYVQGVSVLRRKAIVYTEIDVEIEAYT